MYTSKRGVASDVTRNSFCPKPRDFVNDCSDVAPIPDHLCYALVVPMHWLLPAALVDDRRRDLNEPPYDIRIALAGDMAMKKLKQDFTVRFLSYVTTLGLGFDAQTIRWSICWWLASGDAAPV
jgi:hypothetical protein